MTNTHGGKREGSGRKPGVPNKNSAELRQFAQGHGTAAIEKLCYLMENSENEKIVIMACKELLDRGYGRSTVGMSYSEVDHANEEAEAEEFRQKLIKLAEDVLGNEEAPETDGRLSGT